MSWVENLDDVRPIRAVFGETVALSNEINVHDVVIHRDGPEVRLRFDLEAFPSDPPRKWLVDGFNTVQVDLSLFDVLEFSMSGLARLMRCRIEVSRTDGLIVTQASSAGVSLVVRSRFASVVGLRPYVDAERVTKRC